MSKTGKTDIAIIMGSQSDWSVMKFAADTLAELDISHEARIVSAHRTPDRLYEFAKSAREEGFSVIIAGAGGAAHLPGMTASMTTLPVFGVPVESKSMNGIDSLYSIVQMPAGIPVGTLAIGKAGAINAALLAASVLALNDEKLAKRLDKWRAEKKFKNYINYDRVEEFRHFTGIRIEDNVLVTGTGHRILGDPIPKSVDEVEALRDKAF